MGILGGGNLRGRDGSGEGRFAVRRCLMLSFCHGLLTDLGV